jgi:hypothetical protein
LNLSDDHLDRDRVVTTARHDHISVPLARLDELEVHRLNRREVLIDDFVERTSAVAGVTFETPNQPNVSIRVDKYFDVAQLPHSLIDKKQNAIDDDDVSRLDADGLCTPEVGHEIVFGFVDCAASTQCLEVIA